MFAALLLDLYETLVTERDTAPVRASSLGERLGLDAAAFRKAWRPQRPRVVRGELSFSDALLEVGAMLGRTLDPALVRTISDERRLEKASTLQRVFPEALATVRALRDRGCRLAVVSNCFAEDVEGWPRCPAAECFDASVFSFAVGAAKPDPRIYVEATRRLGVEASQAAFVGDGGDDELLGAERAGPRAAQATWFRDGAGGLPPHIPRLSSWPEVLSFVEAG